MNYKAKRWIFVGRVQGVGFRYTVLRMAGPYEIAGYVRNLPDRTVELVAQGPGTDVDTYLREIREYFGRSVREVKTTDLSPNPRYTDFRISY